ncbi:MAG: hypothetical protein ABSD67_18340 [Terracidiphilus sp.]|jgi:hypothetical protein
MGITRDCSPTSQPVDKASRSGNLPSHRSGLYVTVHRGGCPNPPSSAATSVALTRYAPCLANDNRERHIHGELSTGVRSFQLQQEGGTAGGGSFVVPHRAIVSSPGEGL